MILLALILLALPLGMVGCRLGSLDPMCVSCGREVSLLYFCHLKYNHLWPYLLLRIACKSNGSCFHGLLHVLNVRVWQHRLGHLLAVHSNP